MTCASSCSKRVVRMSDSTVILPGTPAGIRRAAAALREGQLVAFPTETVYGLAADAGNAAAVNQVFAAKGRPAGHPLIIHLPAGTDLAKWSACRGTLAENKERLAAARALAAAFWPGPLTLILPRGERVLPEVTGGQPTVALRVPASPVAQALLQATELPLVGPSANRFGRISPTSAQHVLQELAGRIPFILDGGPSSVGLESTILDLSGTQPRILRPGFITPAQLEEVLQLPVAAGADVESPRVPGTLASHYAPVTPTRLLDAGAFERFVRSAGSRSGVISLQGRPAGFPGIWRQLPADSGGYARELYGALRELDETAEAIIVELPPAAACWDAVHDRLRRAAA